MGIVRSASHYDVVEKGRPGHYQSAPLYQKPFFHFDHHLSKKIMHIFILSSGEDVSSVPPFSGIDFSP